MTAEPEFPDYSTEAEWLGAEPEIPEEYTMPGFFGTRPEYGPILKYVDSVNIFQSADEVPVGTLMQDSDGEYCVRLVTGEFLTLGAQVPSFLHEPEGETPYFRVDMDDLGMENYSGLDILED
jgi:hypothetical protein